VCASPGIPPKARANVRKHGVTFEEASTVFADPLALIVNDPAYSERSLIIGESIVRRILVAVFVEIADDEIRLISARRATRHERRNYEQGQG
jgi:uncharacterized DUF497 family protein